MCVFFFFNCNSNLDQEQVAKYISNVPAYQNVMCILCGYAFHAYFQRKKGHDFVGPISFRLFEVLKIIVCEEPRIHTKYEDIFGGRGGGENCCIMWTILLKGEHWSWRFTNSLFRKEVFCFNFHYFILVWENLRTPIKCSHVYTFLYTHK